MAVLFAAATGLAAQAQTPPPPAAAPSVQPAPASPVTAPPSPPPQPQVQTAPPTAPSSSVVALPPQPPPPSLSGPPTEKRGFLNNLDFSKWWDQSIADFKAKMQDQQSKIDQLNKQSSDAAKDAASATSQAMKDAANAMTHFSHVVEVQQTCPVAGNGAADCATAATNACKAKGYKTGQPLDVRTAEKCADSLWVSGQAPARADCPVETVILRVACQ